MSFIAWIVLGLIAGFIGSQVVNRRGEGVLGDTLVGVVGALLGGLIFNAFGKTGITGLNVWSLFVAVLGSILLLVAYHNIRRRAA